jgi:hypothetical protein
VFLHMMWRHPQFERLQNFRVEDTGGVSRRGNQSQ